MIGEFSVHARSSNNKAKIVFTVSLLSALACVIVCMFVDKYESLIGVLALGFIVVGVFFYTKYISSEYFYDVTFDADNRPIFVIRQRIGRRYTTLTRADLWSLRRIERKSREELKAYRPEAGVSKYVYTPTFLPDSVLILSIRARYERADVIIEATDEFKKFLECAAAEASRDYILSEQNEDYGENTDSIE